MFPRAAAPRALRLLLASGAVALAAPAAYGPPELLCRFQDPAIREASGLAASSRSDDLVFTHNDSGDLPRFFAVGRDGATLAVFRVTGARNLDWEDMARGPDEAGRPCLYLADIGDNLRFRPNVQVYRVPEPAPDPAHPGQAADTPPAVRFDLEYEDGPHDAEAFSIHPRTGQAVVVTKSRSGSGVYATAGRLRAGAPNRLRRMARIDFAHLAPDRAAQEDPRGLLATGADIAPEGDRLVVRTYTEAWEWTLPPGPLATAFREKPVRIPLPDAPYGEAIAYSRRGDALLVCTEGPQAPLHLLRLNAGSGAGR